MLKQTLLNKDFNSEEYQERMVEKCPVSGAGRIKQLIIFNKSCGIYGIGLMAAIKVALIISKAFTKILNVF